MRILTGTHGLAMSEAALPGIRVTDAQNLEGSASDVESPTTAADGGQSISLRSAASSEGRLAILSFCDVLCPHGLLEL